MSETPAAQTNESSAETGLPRCEYCKGELSSIENDRGDTACGRCRAEIAEGLET